MLRQGLTRRDVLKTLAIGAAGGSVLSVIPMEAAVYAHQLVQTEKAAAEGKYTPKFFNPHQYRTLLALCDAIIPKDEKSAGALDAGAPEFIDLLTSENKKYQLKLGGGLMWLDAYCLDHYGQTYLHSAAGQCKEVLELIAFRKNVSKNHELSQGVAFFAFLRDLTCDGFYTSKIGIADLQYIGNQVRSEWPGCPPLPE